MHSLFLPDCPAVVPILIGPLATLVALLPAILVGLAGLFKPAGARKVLKFLWHQKIFTLCLAAFIWWYWWGPSLHLFQAVDTASVAGADWTAFRGGPSRRAALPDGEEPTVGVSVWNYSRDANVWSSPSIVGNRVFVATVVGLGPMTNRGAVVCVDADTGKELWRYAPSSYHATFSSPAVVQDPTDEKKGYVVCGEGLHTDTAARIVCLDKATGEEIWTYRTRGHLECSPTVADGRVYIGAGLDGYYCLDLKPGPDGNPVVRWRLDPEKLHISDCESPPLVLDGVVYVGFGTLGIGGQANRIGPGGVMALNADSGAELWRIDTPCPVFAPPAMADGKLYVGMGIGDFVNDWVQMKAPKPIGQVWCIDLKTRNVDWKFEARDAVLSAVVPVGDRIFFGSRDGNFYALNKQGHIAASFHAHEPIVTSPAIGEQYVYFATMGGRLYGLRADTLAPVWTMSLGSGSGFLSSPSLARGHIYIGTAENGLRCIGSPGEKPIPSWIQGAQGGVVDTSFVPNKVDLAWRYPKDTNSVWKLTAPLTPHNGAVYAIVATGMQAETSDQNHTSMQYALVKLKLDRGLDDAQRLDWQSPLTQPVVLPPAAFGDCIYLVDGLARDPNANRTLRCLSTIDGKERWNRPLPAHSDGQFTLDADRVHVAVDQGRVAAYNRTSGAPLYTTLATAALPISPVHNDDPTIGEALQAHLQNEQDRLRRGAPVVTGDYLIHPSLTTLQVHDAQSGVLLWDIPTEAPIEHLIAIDNTVACLDAKTLSLRSLVDGKRLWSVPLVDGATPPVRIGSSLAVITGAKQLKIFALSDGAERKTVEGADPAVVPLPISPDRLIFRDFKDIAQLDLSTGQTSRWYGPAAWLGPNCTPLVFIHQQLCFGTTTKGVVCLSARK